MLFRGDARDGVAVPDPTAATRVVAHILYLGGAGRRTPFTSTSASRVAAEHFAVRAGRVWRTDDDLASEQGANCITNSELLQNLTGSGKGQCKWDDPFEVAQARAYVKQWHEHLLDWRSVEPDLIAARIRAVFS